jgi:DNA-directed RNA polymerase subunit RPC12/RpoP
MPRCPKCGSEIDYLIEYSKEWRRYRVRLIGDSIEYEETGDAVVIDHEYVCPHCETTIAITEEEAKRFLSR